MKTRTRWVVGAGGALVAVVVVAMLLRGGALEVQVTEVRRDSLSVTVSDEGRTRVRDRFVVATPIAGRLSRVEVREGARVEAGDPLATIHPVPEGVRATAALRSRVEAAEARVSQARAGLAEASMAREQARREYERRVPLLEMGAITREALERAEQAAEAAAAREQVAQATLATAEAELRSARAGLIGTDPAGSGAAPVPMRAPVSGVVLRIHEESERVVQAGTPLLDIADPGGLEVVADVLTSEAVSIVPGAEVVVSEWGGEGALRGEVRYVEPEAFTEVSVLGIEEQRVNVVLDLVDPPARLGAGYRVEVAITVRHEADALVVPASALFQRSSRWMVFVVEDGRARARSVEVGARARDRVQIVSGLEAGDEVVVFPSDEVAEGARLAARGESGA